MQSDNPIAIVGFGTFFPDDVRTNDYWPEQTVARWREEIRERATARRARWAGRLTEGERVALDAIERLELDDPFYGGRERRVLSADEFPSSMETAAAAAALNDADIAPRDIDVVLTYASCPDFQAVNHACHLQHELGLPASCFSLAVEGACNSFLLQLELATSLIAAGRADRILLTQSTALTKVVPMERHYSAWFGDGASAVVVERWRGRGHRIEALAHRSHGEFSRAVVVGAPKRRWYEGPSVFYAEDWEQAERTLLCAPDMQREVIDLALADAELNPADVEFFACHQGTAWFRPTTQAYANLDQALSLDTFSRYGNLAAVNIPAILTVASELKMINDDAATMLTAGGSGISNSAVLLRWAASA